MVSADNFVKIVSRVILIGIAVVTFSYYILQLNKKWLFVSSFSIYKSSQTHVILMAIHGVIMAGPVHSTIMGMLFVIAQHHTYLLSVTKSNETTTYVYRIPFSEYFSFLCIEIIVTKRSTALSIRLYKNVTVFVFDDSFLN